jgi:hypothetical protein
MHQLALSRRKILIITINLLTIIIFISFNDGQCDQKKYNCKISMYKKGEINNPSTIFSPYDKIFIDVHLHQLPIGQYTLNTLWYNPSGELQENTLFDFNIMNKSNFRILSWLKLHKASPARRLFFGSNYNIKFFGNWHVELYLNGDKICTRYFDIR